MQIKTMTLHEVTNRLRSMGVKTGPSKIADGIEAGIYPFGVMIRKNGTKRTFEIYESEFEKWAASKCTSD